MKLKVSSYLFIFDELKPVMEVTTLFQSVDGTNLPMPIRTSLAFCCA